MRRPIWSSGSTRALWQLLLEDPSDLNCSECFAVMEYFAELLAEGRTDLLPRIVAHLKGCPNCEAEYSEALSYLLVSQSQADLTESRGSKIDEQDHLGNGKAESQVVPVAETIGRVRSRKVSQRQGDDKRRGNA